MEKIDDRGIGLYVVFYLFSAQLTHFVGLVLFVCFFDVFLCFEMSF